MGGYWGNFIRSVIEYHYAYAYMLFLRELWLARYAQNVREGYFAYSQY